MDKWDDVNNTAPKGTIKKKPLHLSDSTRTGLRVTIMATLRLFKFLVDSHDFKYLMTDRLNQDALEASIKY